jgi:hypothetical protein
MKITGEKSFFDAIRGIREGSVLRITFAVNAGDDIQRKLLRLQHKLSFDGVWVAVMQNRIAAFQNWKDLDAPSRTHDFTVKAISGADPEVFAYELHSYVEAVEVVQL